MSYRLGLILQFALTIAVAVTARFDLSPFADGFLVGAAIAVAFHLGRLTGEND